MGFLERLKASQTNNTGWRMLTDINQLNEIDKVSASRPVIIFKHSTSCGISAGAKYRLESDWSEISEEVEFYYLDLLSYRKVSNFIAEKYNVRHESPQILVIHKGEVKHKSSHHRIDVKSLNEALV